MMIDKNEELQNIVHNAPIGICIIDAATLVSEMVNDTFVEVSGKSYGAIYGKHYWETFAEAAPYYEAALASVINEGKTFRADEVDLMVIRRGKPELLAATFVYEPVKDKNGLVQKVAVWVLESTQHEKSRQVVQKLNADMQLTIDKLAEQEKILRIALESASMDLWQVDLTGNTTTMSDQMKRIHHVPLNQEISLDQAVSAVAEEFRESVSENLMKAAETGEMFSAEYIIHPMDGSEKRWVRSTGVVSISAGNSSRKMLIGTCLDITEEKQNEQRKSDFIGMVSHEMKTPLTSLSGYMQILHMKAGVEDAFVNTMLDKAVKQIGRMTTLINGFLNISRLESGKIYIDKTRFNLAELIKEVEEEILSTVSSHTVTFASGEAAWVEADRDKINQVIDNLISNSIKYSPVDTVIHVMCSIHNDMAVIRVKDDGIGIRPDDQPKLFDRYYRVNNNNATSASGFGIGLYLCAEIIQRHSGKIWVESELGKGSSFYFALPIAKQF